jgi:hypothetical protein
VRRAPGGAAAEREDVLGLRVAELPRVLITEAVDTIAQARRVVGVAEKRPDGGVHGVDERRCGVAVRRALRGRLQRHLEVLRLQHELVDARREPGDGLGEEGGRAFAHVVAVAPVVAATRLDDVQGVGPVSCDESRKCRDLLYHRFYAVAGGNDVELRRGDAVAAILQPVELLAQRSVSCRVVLVKQRRVESADIVRRLPIAFNEAADSLQVVLHVLRHVLEEECVVQGG